MQEKQKTWNSGIASSNTDKDLTQIPDDCHAGGLENSQSRKDKYGRLQNSRECLVRRFIYFFV